jgi:hypothetical protein
VRNYPSNASLSGPTIKAQNSGKKTGNPIFRRSRPDSWCSGFSPLQTITQTIAGHDELPAGHARLLFEWYTIQTLVTSHTPQR